MTSPTLPQIVEDLTEAMRRAIIEAKTMHRLGFPAFERITSCGAALTKRGLARRETNRFIGGRGKIRESHHYGLTPLGMEVRTHLLSLGEGM